MTVWNLTKHLPLFPKSAYPFYPIWNDFLVSIFNLNVFDSFYFFSLDIYSIITSSYPGWGKGLTLVLCPHPLNLLWLHFIQASNLVLITVQCYYRFDFRSLPLPPPQVCRHIINICSNLLYYFFSQTCIKLSGWCYMYWYASLFMHLKTHANRVFLNLTHEKKSQDLSDKWVWIDSSQNCFFVNPLKLDHSQKVKCIQSGQQKYLWGHK